MARGQLLGKYSIAAATFMSVLMMTLMARLFLGLFIGGSGFAGIILNAILSFIISLLSGVLNVGVLYMALKLCCREDIRVTDVFYGFSFYLEKIIAIQAVFAAASLVFNLPGDIFLWLYQSSGELSYLQATVLLYIAGYIAYLAVALVLSQVFFLLLDFAEKSPQELLKMAYVVMDGHKLRLLLLWLSFVPLLLLGVATCFLGFIWIVPYIRVTQANFYMDLMQNR